MAPRGRLPLNVDSPIFGTSLALLTRSPLFSGLDETVLREILQVARRDTAEKKRSWNVSRSAERFHVLRGYFVFAAWLNHVDAKNTNSLATLVTEEGRSFIRRYLLDFGSILGSAGIGPREGWEGFETLVEQPKEILKRSVTFGARVPEWRMMEFYERPSLGRVPREHASWTPERWQPHITNAAFRHARADDKFWAAGKLAAIDEDMVRAAVVEGR